MRMQAEPGLGLKPCQVELGAEFRDRRHIGQIGQAFARRHRQRHHIAILDLRQRGRQIVNQAIHLAPDHRRHGRASAAIGHMLHAHAGKLVDQLPCQMG